MLRHKPSPQSSPNRLRSPPRPPLPPARVPRPGGPMLPVSRDVGRSGECPAPAAAPEVLGAHGHTVWGWVLGVDPPSWGAFGCWWRGGGVSHWCPTPLPTLPGCRDGGMPGNDAQATAWGSGGARGHRWPWHLWQCHQPVGAQQGTQECCCHLLQHPASTPAGTAGTGKAQAGTLQAAPPWVPQVGGLVQRWGGTPQRPSGFRGEFGACRFRLRNPTWDAVSTATAGQRAARGAGCSARDCNCAASAKRPPGRGTGARCRAGRWGHGGEGRWRCGGCAGRGGGQAGAAGEAASGSVWHCQQRCH